MAIRFLQIVALGLLALAAAGTAQGTVEAPISSTLTVEPRGGHFGSDPRRLSVVLDLGGEAAPGRISIQAPKQFWLAPERDEGDLVGQAEIDLRSGSGPLLHYAGTISSAPIEVAVAAGCSADEIAGAWLIRAAHGRKTLELPIALASDGGTRLDLCPAVGQRVAALALSLTGVVPPAARGSYGWSAFVTPRAKPSAAYELRAIVPVPHVLTLRGAYQPGTRSAALTGSLRARGKPRQWTEIDVVRLDRTAVPLAFYDSWDAFANTSKLGTYSVHVPLTRTQGFVASTPPTVKPCSGRSTVPAGCRSTTTAGAESDPVTVSVP